MAPSDGGYRRAVPAARRERGKGSSSDNREGLCLHAGVSAAILLRMNAIEDLIAQLTATTEQMAALLGSVDDQDWRPSDSRWSLRYVAAHLEACQTECVLVRVRQMAFGAKPRFEFYDNEGWDFSDRDLAESVSQWRESRARVFAFIRSLSVERQSRTGSHLTFGEITPVDYLRIDLDHDREHIKDVELMLAEKRSGKGQP